MDTLVASDVRHVSTTWSPAEITTGVAVICAVGAGAFVLEAGAVSVAGGSGVFFLQPATETNATTRTKGVRMRLRSFNGILLPKIQNCHPSQAGLYFCGQTSCSGSFRPVFRLCAGHTQLDAENGGRKRDGSTINLIGMSNATDK
jgi:hypothetical protein